VKTLKQALPAIKRLDAQYWAADERRDLPQVRRLGRLHDKARGVAKNLPILSDADAARKLELAAHSLELLGGPDVEIERLKRLAASIRASATPRLKLLTDADELRVCVSRVTEDRELDYDRILTDNVVPYIEAVIAWLGRPRVEHFPDEGVTVTYAVPGMIMVAGLARAQEARWVSLSAVRRDELRTRPAAEP
jgi:hypothetical protein